ncbi:MAG: S41 family peptidase [Lachnospiraceae bacterium]|nr:S41 family peptidase [Lachnospiraceae bacterium]
MKKSHIKLISLVLTGSMLFTACGQPAASQATQGTAAAQQAEASAASEAASAAASETASETASEAASEAQNTGSSESTQAAEGTADGQNMTAEDQYFQDIKDRADAIAASFGPGERAWKDHTYQIEKKTMPLYFYAPEYKNELDLYFMDGKKGIPYVSANDITTLLNLSHAYQGDPEYKLSMEKDGAKVNYTRESSYSLIMDFDSDTLDFTDYDAFQIPAKGETILDILTNIGPNTALFQVSSNSYERYGQELVVNAGDYGIDLIQQDDEYYVPLQLVSDFLMAHGLSQSILFNGAAVFIITGGNTAAVKDIYNDTAEGEFDEALADFSYKELCMTLDYFYGLKEQHNITNFNALFEETGLMYQLLATDYTMHANAISSLIGLHMDDFHSSIASLPFYFTDNSLPYNSATNTKMANNMDLYQAARQKYYPEAVPFYEEVGNTAFITLDGFDFDMTKDYYKDTPDENASDTVGKMIYAVSRIKRENSPIENVVLDLSQNLGGLVNAAGYTIGALLGYGTYSVRNKLTGALVTQNFNLDVNLDKKFDEKDGLKGYNIFCLVSPLSFSCGNLVPSVLKDSNRVTIIGQTSGGGTCTVMVLTTAEGLIFKLSGPIQLSYAKNGAFYDIDQGVEPHYHIANIDHFYDRNYLNKYVNNIMENDNMTPVQ